MDFGMKLQNLRKTKGLSQEALAEKLNVSRQAVSKWESGSGYPEMDKLILLSELFGVTIDYLIKDSDSSDQTETEDITNKYFMNQQRIKDYMKRKKIFGICIAASVAAIILSVCIPILCHHKTYESMGNFVFLVIIAIAVFCLIFTGIMSQSDYELENKKINMSFQDLQDLQNKYSRFQLYFGISIAFGVFLIIMSVAVIGFFENVYNEDVLSAQLMVCVAIAVFIFIYQGIRYGMYQFLVQNKKYINDKKREESSLFSITMPLAAILYLLLGFTKGLWHPGWIIFPIVAIITAFIERVRMNR